MHSISLPKVASRRSPRMPTPSGASALTCCTFPLCFLFPRLFCRCLFLSALLAKSLTKGSVSVLFKLLHDYSPDTLVCSAGVEACLLFCFCTSSRPASLPGAPRHCPAGRYWRPGSASSRQSVLHAWLSGPCSARRHWVGFSPGLARPAPRFDHDVIGQLRIPTGCARVIHAYAHVTLRRQRPLAACCPLAFLITRDVLRPDSRLNRGATNVFGNFF